MLKHRRLRWLLTVIALFSLFAAACGDDEDTGTGDTTDDDGGDGGGTTYTIAFVGPLTGPNASLGIFPRDGARIAIEEANAEGGDVKFELKSFDTQGDPAQAPTVKDKYINDDSVIGIVGPVFSGETKAVLPAYETADLVMVSPSATGVDIPDTVKGSTSFHRVVPDDDVQAAAVSGYVTEVLGADSVYYVHDNADYGKGLAEGTKAILEGAGVESAGIDAIDPKGQDYSAAVNKVQAADPDVVYYGGYYTEGGRLQKQLKDAGIDATFMCGDGCLDLGFAQSAGAAAAEGAKITCACRLASGGTEGELGEFAKRYKDEIGKDPGTYATEGYDAANLIIDAVKAGNTTRAEVRDYIEGIDTYEGISKTIEFEENGNLKVGDVYAYEFKGGKIELLGTIEELVGG